MLNIRNKWRPSLVTLITVVVGTLIALPLIGLITARLTSNQFVRETESSLISQAGIMAQVFANEYENRSTGPLHGQVLNAELLEFYAQKFHHTPVSLTTHKSAIRPERPAPKPNSAEIDAIYVQVGAVFSKVAENAQKTSLAGYQAVDVHGTVIGGTAGLEGSFAGIAEIETALRGQPVSVLRYRSDRNRRHPLASISRDTAFRVFVALPVIVENQVVGAVYLARTPSNLRSFLFRERQTILLVAAFVLLAASIVGMLLWRLLARPIGELQRQSEDLASGQRVILKPISHYGTKETARLGRSILSMSTKLKQRSDNLQTYTAHVTHELKSPLTSIIGAVELLDKSGGKMGATTRHKFYGNIQMDGNRMIRLLDDLRSLAASDMVAAPGSERLQTAIERCQSEFPNLDLAYVGDDDLVLPIAGHDLDVILVHLAQNALQHGARQMTISGLGQTMSIQDDGTGISDANLDKIFQPFFTTNRDHGGTGMGLAIVQSTINANGGEILVKQSATGAAFTVMF